MNALRASIVILPSLTLSAHAVILFSITKQRPFCFFKLFQLEGVLMIALNSN